MFFGIDDDDELLTNMFKNLNYSEQKLYKQAMIGIVLLSMDQHFECFSANKFKGTVALNSTCDELIAEMKLRKKECIEANKKISEWQEEIKLYIIVVLSVIFYEVFYLLQVNDHTVMMSFKAKILFGSLLSKSSNAEIYKKIIGLYGLLGLLPTKVESTLLGDFYENMNIFMLIMQQSFVKKTMNDLIMLMQQGQEIRRPVLLQLFRNNKAKMSNRAFLLD